jgi:23S rRNA (adenine2503-C2)-methyltransferase
MNKVNLVGATLEEIEKAVTGMGEPRYRASQIFAGICRRRLHSWDQFTDLSRLLRERLKARYAIEYPRIQEVFVSQDGTRRYLLKLIPGEEIESVFIPEEKRDTVCISTQAGCSIGCPYCATGKLPMKRNLTPGEIIGQILLLQADRNTGTKRLNVVIMGMGEPLNNYENVMTAIRLMTHESGMSISPRRITLSTAGVVPGIERLASEKAVPNLAVSLNATTDSVRDRLIPINKRWNIHSLLNACRSFPLKHRRHITIEYILIKDVNDSKDDAQRLVRLLHGFKKKINLIPLNADSSIPFQPPDKERVLQFQKILADHHITAKVRRPRGEDISAACGMLAGRKKARN